MKGQIGPLASVALLAALTLAVLGTWRFAFAHGPDVNSDGRVNIVDIARVVRAFGQVMDSCQDIQGQVSELRPSGGEIIIPTGTYTCTSPIVVNRDNVGLRGQGPGTVLRLADGANSPVIVVGPTNPNPEQLPQVRNVHISDLTIDGNRLNQTFECWGGPCSANPIRNNGIDLRHVSDVSVERVTVHSARSGGLVTERGSQRVTVRDFTSYNNYYDGLGGYETEDSVFSGLYLYNNCAAGLSFDLNFNRNIISDAVILRDATSTCAPHADGTVSIFMRDASDNAFQGIQIRSSREHGIFLAKNTDVPPPYPPASGNTFSGIVVSGSGEHGLRANDVSVLDTLVDGAQFIDNGGDCISEALPGQVQQGDIVCR